ncbi:MAG: AAA domain-containing protein [Actinobacteria bacterium]|nr:AAA domain-containing protein [Actinomycetota bacterium]
MDFLEDFYALRYPPVHDISSYNDILIRRADIEYLTGIELNTVGEVWLTADLLPTPIPPEPPDKIAKWIADPINPNKRPTVRHFRPDSQALIEVIERALKFSKVTTNIYNLNKDQLVQLSLKEISSDAECQAAITAIGELHNAERDINLWITNVWEPWVNQYNAVEHSRDLYKKLFDLKNRIERERDAYECLWGFGRLRWTLKTGEVVDHPIACVPVEFKMDIDSGRITIERNGAVSIDQSWTAGLSLTDKSGFNQLRDKYNDTDPWSEQAVTNMTKLLRSIDHDGVISRSGYTMHQPEHHPILYVDDWVLYVRRRQLNLLDFLHQQRQLYTDAPSTIPDPFAALVVDQPSAFDTRLPSAPIDNNNRTTVDNDRMLLPLASNDEQMQILNLARTNTGVTVQGPPGTGKSHTIANLISHYIACGQRVLVTAEKEQALAVLIDKVPEDIRDLCIPVLGTDVTARSRLQATITAITNAAVTGTEQADISRLNADLDNIECSIVTTINELKSCRGAEVESVPNPPHEYSPDEWTPSIAAKWLTDNESRLSGIPDRLHYDTPVPITSQELAELIELCSTLNEEDSQAALDELPDPATLPTGAQLATWHLEADRLHHHLEEFNEHITDWLMVESAGLNNLNALASQLDQWATWFTKIRGTWIERVIADATDSALAVGWMDFYTSAGEEREKILAADRSLAAHTVTLNTPLEDPDFKELLEKAGNPAKQAISSLKFPRRLRSKLKRCQVDGYPLTSADDYALFIQELNRLTYRKRLSLRWDNIVKRYNAPPLANNRPIEDQIGEHIHMVQTAIAWRVTTWPQFVECLSNSGIVAPATPQTAEAISNMADICRNLGLRVQFREHTRKLEAVVDRLRIAGVAPDASPIWRDLLDAFENRSFDDWDHLREAAGRLLKIRSSATRRHKLLHILGSSAPQLTEQIVAGNQTIHVKDFEEAWKWRQLEVWFDTFSNNKEPAELQDSLEQLVKDRRRVIIDLVATQAWMAVASSIDDRRRRALNRFTTANRKLGKGTGRYARQWEVEMRAGMDDAKDAVPAWIMPIHRVFSSFRPAADPPFDVLIIDEASQIGILEVPVLALAKKAIIVGDDQQTSPENVGMNRQEVFDRIDTHLPDIRDRRTRFDSDNSLYDIARQQFPKVVQLREHFRCLPKIISFSNHHWYNDTIIPLRDRPPCPGWQPLGTVYVPGGVRMRNNDTNLAEAQAIIRLIEELVANPDYNDKSFGVISLLGSGQAPLINGMLIDRFGPSMIEERKLRVGDPASFQGDERDIIIISLVVAYDPDNVNRSIGAMNRLTHARRINVAASRARDQLWVVHSVQPASLHQDDPRRALLEHCHNTNAGWIVNGEGDPVMDRTESQFERDVLTRIRDAGYTRTTTQYRVGGYRIDLVVEGPENRLGIECDGDRWHGPDAWDRDRARQEVLERAGWTFVHIRGSAFYRNPDQALRPLWKRLDQLQIPKGDWLGKISNIGMHRKWPDDFDNKGNDES